jgi:thiol:disulfide interchange protein DsbC
MKKILVALSVSAAAFAAVAADSPSTEAVKDKLAKLLDVPRENIRPSPVAGFYEVQHDHDYGYVSADGKYLLQGDLIDIDTGEQITENRRRADRLVALKALDKDNTIEFAPKAPFATKYTVTVFTDMDCHYCQLLHSQVADYNAAGISLRYAFFPRTGPNTESWKKAEAVWCSDDRHAALTKAKAGGTIKAKACENPVGKEYALGEQLGVRGTPMLILPSGEQVMGYLPPKVLAAKLAAEDAPKAKKG